MDRRQLLLAGVATAGGLLMPDATPLEQAQATTKRFRRELATGNMSAQLPRLREHVAAITDLVKAARTPRDQTAAQRALAEVSVLHANAAEDGQHLREARQAASSVLTSAREAGEPDLAAVGWVKLAVCTLDDGRDAPAAVRCAQRAERIAVTASIKANAAAWEAIGHASHGRGPGWAGNAYFALAAMERAETHIDKDEHSPWKWVSPSTINKLGGIVDARIGRPEAGEEKLKQALFKIAPQDHKTLWLLMDLTETYVLMNEPEGAALTALEAFDGAVERRSTLKLERLREVTRPLFVRWPDEPRVKELGYALACERATTPPQEPIATAQRADGDWVRGGEAAEILGLSVKRVQQLADGGQLVTQRTLGGHRVYQVGSLRAERERRRWSQ